MTTLHSKTMAATLLTTIWMVAVATAQENQNAHVPQGRYYKWYPDSRLFLGYGFDYRDPTAAKLHALPVKQAEIDAHVPDAGALTVSFDSRTTESHDELYDALQFDTELEARFLVGHVSAQFGLNKVNFTRTDSLTIVMSAVAKYPPKSLPPGVTLIKDAQLLVNQGPAFVAKYGTHYISEVTMGAAVHAVITLSKLTDESRKELKAGLTGGAWGADFSARLKKQLNTKQNSSDTTIRVVAFGGEGIEALDTLITAGTDPNAIRNALAVYAKTLGVTNAVPVGARSRPFEDFEVQTNEKLNVIDRKRQTMLFSIAEQHRDASEQHKTAVTYLDMLRRLPEKRRGLNKDEQELLKECVASIAKHADNLKEAHKSLLTKVNAAPFDTEAVLKDNTTLLKEGTKLVNIKLWRDVVEHKTPLDVMRNEIQDLRKQVESATRVDANRDEGHVMINDTLMICWGTITCKEEKTNQWAYTGTAQFPKGFGSPPKVFFSPASSSPATSTRWAAYVVNTKERSVYAGFMPVPIPPKKDIAHFRGLAANGRVPYVAIGIVAPVEE